jgi:hypothetical protein
MGAGGLGSPKYAQPFQPMLNCYDSERGGYRRLDWSSRTGKSSHWCQPHWAVRTERPRHESGTVAAARDRGGGATHAAPRRLALLLGHCFALLLHALVIFGDRLLLRLEGFHLPFHSFLLGVPPGFEDVTLRFLMRLESFALCGLVGLECFALDLLLRFEGFALTLHCFHLRFLQALERLLLLFRSFLLLRVLWIGFGVRGLYFGRPRRRPWCTR